jgi:hypothetical protein
MAERMRGRPFARAWRRLTREHAGGALMVAIGAGVALAARGYEIGTLRAMGSGFFPLVLGVLLVAVGLAVLLTSPLKPAQARGAGPAPGDARAAAPALATRPDARAWVCILGGVLSFVALGRHGGLVPASFVSVFVAAMGDRGNTARDAALLAAAMTIFGVLVFHAGLHVLLPLFAWE